MEIWLLFFLLSLLCFTFGLASFARHKRGKSSFTGPCVDVEHPEPSADSTNTFVALSVSDGKLLCAQTESNRYYPNLLDHYIDQIKNRFVLATSDETAQIRARFLRTQIAQLELGKQYQALINDLVSMEYEQENREQRLEFERSDLKIERDHAEALRNLRLTKARLDLEVAIAELRSKKATFKKIGSVDESVLTAEQKRRLKRVEIEDKLRELDRLEEDALKNARRDEDRVRIINMHADKREELRGQLSKFLV